MAVYDIFLFFNEIELLELRLNILNDSVDCFIICESDKTFSNNYKGYVFEENKHKFQKFLHKIHYIKTTFNFSDPWENESYQRDIINRFLPPGIQNEDMVIFSDLDEIPNPEIIKKHRDSDLFLFLDMKVYYFYFNMFTDGRKWRKAKLLKYKLYKKTSPQNIRDITPHFEYYFEAATLIIKNAGWHYSWICEIEKMLYKIESYSHQEQNNSKFKDYERIKRHIDAKMDLFEKGKQLSIEEINSWNSPAYLVENISKYNQFIYPPQ